MLKKRRQLWALFLSVVLIGTQLPVMVMAENNVPENGNIVSAETSDSSVEKPSVQEETEGNLSDMEASYEVPESTEEKSSEIPSIEPLLCSKTEDCSLLDEHEGECIVPLPANGSLAKTIIGWTFVDDENLNEGELPLIGVSEDNQADLDTVVSMLPTQISGLIEGGEGSVTLNIISWSCPDYKQDTNSNWPLTGEYTFMANMPEGYACSPVPAVKIVLGDGQTYDTWDTSTTAAYLFDAAAGILKIIENAGTTQWRNDPQVKEEDVKKVVFEKGVTSIGDKAFYDCLNLKEVELPEGLTSIGDNAFYKCSNLKEIELPEGLTTIGKQAFWNCTGLEEVNLPEGLTTLGEDVFYLCKGLKRVNLPEGLTTLGKQVFNRCSGLKEIKLPASLTSIGDKAFMYCSSLEEVEIPEKITIIGVQTFSNCTRLKKFTFPEKLKTIGTSAFQKCESLTKVILPDNLELIDQNAFEDCSNLTEVIIPAGIVTVGSWVFRDNDNLKSVTFLGKNAPNIGENIFLNSPGAAISVPAGASGYSEKFSGTIPINTIPVPVIMDHPQDVTITAGSTANFTVTATGAQPFSFQWQENKGSGWENVTDGIGRNTSSYTTIKAHAGMNGWQYRCIITNVSGSVTSEAAAVKVLTYSGGSSNSVYEPKGSYEVTGDKISQNVSSLDLKKLADASKSLTLSCDKTSMTFDSVALKAILEAVPATADNITFASVPVDLSGDVAELIGSRPVYNFTISYKDSKGNPVMVPVNFSKGSVSIAINYTPVPNEVMGNLFMVYVDSKGAATWLDKSNYVDGKVLAEVSHFSIYGIAYKVPIRWPIERRIAVFRHKR